MNSNEQKEFINLLNQKKSCLADILQMTKERKFSPVEEDVERFQNFFDKREVLFQRCRVFENKIKSTNISQEDKNSLFYKEVEKTTSETDKIIKEIIELDKKNRTIMDQLMALIKKNLRDMKVSQKINYGYSDFYQGQSYGGFDSQK